MQNSQVRTVILSGGSGTRLWPLSRKGKPKQFMKIASQHSLLQNTILRCTGDQYFEKPIIVGADEHRFLIKEEVHNLDMDADIILEPVARNTCAAIAAAAFFQEQIDPDVPILVVAADHWIKDTQAFSQAVNAASVLAEQDHLVTFGVRPTYPATGYGYIMQGEACGDGFKVEKFIEKPDQETAKDFITKGFLWNSGNFVFKPSVFLRELEALNNEIYTSVKSAFENKKIDLGFHRLDQSSLTDCPSVSVDVAVMEQTDKAAVLPVDYDWSDIGSWSEIEGFGEQKPNGNASFGDAHFHSTTNTFVHSEGKLTATLGLENAIVVTMNDVVMVADKAYSQEVKHLVETLTEDKREEVTEASQVFRPWGNYESLDSSDGYQVKRIVVNPGGILSLQKHKHRAEHWVVVSGIAEVTIDEKVSLLHPNQSIYVPLGSVHRLANRGDDPVILIEVQTGDYLGEDDIFRLEDVYNRTADD